MVTALGNMKFQFQTGSIKSGTSSMFRRGHSKFQFQTGSIKSNAVFDGRHRNTCFNSKLVRLKVVELPVSPFVAGFQFQTGSIKRTLDTPQKRSLTEFQFQTGSIKSYTFDIDINVSTAFQFQTGSIKRIGLIYLKRVLEKVSIPNWFD